MAGGLAAVPTTALAAGSPASYGHGAPRPEASPHPALPAFTAFTGPHGGPRLPDGQQLACPAPSAPEQMRCMSIVRTVPSRTSAHPGGRTPVSPRGSAARTAGPAGPARTARVKSALVPFGYSPASLRGAYKLAKAALARGRGETVAIVDAYRDPKAAGDLARYRSRYRLPACTTSTRCLRVVNQKGSSGLLPVANASWAFEQSLDLDMVSAVCPHCHILLIEASSANLPSLATAEDTAVAMGAKFISNSWDGQEFTGERAFDRYFNHPGVVITFAAGDSGYGTAFPADTQYVTAVGGTTLRRAAGLRGWSEKAWSGTGSGCSALAAKASWQTADDSAPDGCLDRTGNDVAADANPNTGVSVYDSYRTGGTWLEAGGTSAAAPIIASVYALAGRPAPDTYPAQYPYQHPSGLFDVTSGGNGTCESNRQYLCHGLPGYDGPTGLGTPDGTTGFAPSNAPQVTLLDPGTQDAAAGSAFTLTIKGLDTNPAATTLTYSATGLPSGLSIAAVPGSTNGRITGTLPVTPVAVTVTVTASDPKTGASGQASFMIVITSSL